MLAIAAFLLCLAGLAGLALSMTKHARNVFGRAHKEHTQTIMRMTGWALITASLWPCIAWWGVAIGLVAWFGLATAAALLVAIALSYAPSFGASPSGGRLTAGRKSGAR